MSFSGDIRRFNEKVEKAATMIFRGTSLNLFSKIMKRTPVKTGRLRANWFTTIGSPSSRTVEETDKSGRKGIGYAKATTNIAKLGDSIFMVNNLPYAQVIEDGRKDGSGSEQAPQGMVKVTVAEFKQAVAEQAKKV